MIRGKGVIPLASISRKGGRAVGYSNTFEQVESGIIVAASTNQDIKLVLDSPAQKVEAIVIPALPASASSAYTVEFFLAGSVVQTNTHTTAAIDSYSYSMLPSKKVSQYGNAKVNISNTDTVPQQYTIVWVITP